MGETIVGTETMGFCATTANIWQVVGYVLLVFKIVIPILLIVFGMLDLGKAVIASKDDEIKKATKSLAMRAIAGVVIFFLPTIVGLVLGLISNFSSSGAADDYAICRQCITSPNDDGGCGMYAEEAWGN
ncbi:TPA: hypothetical protein IAB95_00820 [Candidatus Ventrenecus avicola]|nr:hypothetical protein [Candidatus Ventrenecus avicola]